MGTTPIPNAEATSTWYPLANEELVFSRGVSPDIQTTQKGRPHAQPEKANIKQAQQAFGVVFIFLIMLWEFLSLTDLLLLYYVFCFS